jgi:nitrogen regulatory protein P-II 1
VKLVSAIVQPPKLPALLAALENVAIERMTICDAQGIDVHSDECTAAGAPSDPTLYRKLLIEIVVNDDFLPRAIDVISHAARTGSSGAIGDGKLFVVPVEEAIQINDARRGCEAV